MVYITEQTGKVKFMGYLLGRISADHFTFFLFRRSWQRVRKHDAYGMSRCLAEALYKKGCRMLIIAVDGINKYKVPMNQFINKGIVDKLSKDQADHIFYPIRKLELIR